MIAEECHIITKISLTIAEEDPMIIKEVIAKRGANKGTEIFYSRDISQDYYK